MDCLDVRNAIDVLSRLAFVRGDQELTYFESVIVAWAIDVLKGFA